MSLLPKRIRERILAKKKKLDSHRPLPPVLVQKLRQGLLIKYTFSSNAIEGNTLTLGETRLVIEEGFTIGGKSVKEHLEALNHPAAISFIEELASQGREIVEDDVLRLHGLIMSGVDSSAGRYREWGVRISGSTFSPPTSGEVPERISTLLGWLRRNPDESSPIELAAKFMHRFSQIHPFVDGNGRVGRLLMNLVLIRVGYPFITNISYRDRARYLRALQEADEGNLKQLVGLVARSVEGTLDSYLRVIEEPKMYSLAEASSRTGIDADYLGLLARRGILPAFKLGGRWSVAEGDLQLYVDKVRRKRSIEYSRSS
ncbi:MAG: Fic family protein [Candidatus Bathyarchaeota archaeon]|nr:Fic family protein [Candidatus Bathyarchaeota archaeon]